MYRYILFCSWESCTLYSDLLWFMQLHIFRDGHFSDHCWKSTVQSRCRLFVEPTKLFRNQVSYPVRDSERFRTLFRMWHCTQLNETKLRLLEHLTNRTDRIIFIFIIFRHLKEYFLAMFKFSDTLEEIFTRFYR